MNDFHEFQRGEKLDTSVFANGVSDVLLVTFSTTSGACTTHIPIEQAQKFAWSILRGADFVNTHKQAEEV